MKLVTNNIKKMPITPTMYCFGGHNICIEMGKIKTVEQLYWYSNDGESIPVLMFTLKDGTKITADYESELDAKEALKYYKREFIKSV
jgi:hypothetical protein